MSLNHFVHERHEKHEKNTQYKLLQGCFRLATEIGFIANKIRNVGLSQQPTLVEKPLFLARFKWNSIFSCLSCFCELLPFGNIPARTISWTAPFPILYVRNISCL